MGRHEPLRLRETSEVFPPGAPVLDVEFTEVGAKPRTLWDRIKAGLQALLWAATIGFLIPPAWVLLQRIGDMFRPL